MVYQILAVVVGIVALMFLLLAFKMLARRGWLLGFVRGLVGFFLVSCAVLMSLTVQDIQTYRVAENDRAIATLSFKQKELYQFEVDLQETRGSSRRLSLQGEQWQLEARMFKWSPLLNAMGIRTGYRLDNVEGRYQVMEMDRSTERTREKLSSSAHFDLWDFINRNADAIYSVQALKGSPGFVPMADGAIFEVVASGKGLIARPINPIAKAAMASW